MKKKIIIVIAISTILILGIVYVRPVPPVSTPLVNKTDAVIEEIHKDVQGIDIGDLDKDFDAVNANIKTL